MKKILSIITLVLLLSGNAYASILSVIEQKNLINNGTIKKGMTKEDLELTISPSVWTNAAVSDFDLKKSGSKVWCGLSGTYPRHKDVGYCFEGKKNNIELECSLKWNAGYTEDIFPYTNNIYQKDGGTHLLGFRSALLKPSK